MTTPPSFSWSASEGSINASGLYTALCADAGTSCTISVSSGGITSTANVLISQQSGLYVGNDGLIYVQATDSVDDTNVNEVKVFTTSGTLVNTLPPDGPFPDGITFRGAQDISLGDGTYLDASSTSPYPLERMNAAGNVIQTYLSYCPDNWWTGMALDPDGRSFWVCDESCYVYEFNIATGAQEQNFYASNDVGGLGVVPNYTPGIKLGDGSTNQVLQVSSDGTKSLVPLHLYVPSNLPNGTTVTLTTTVPNEVDAWKSGNPAAGDTPLLGGTAQTGAASWTVGSGTIPTILYVGATQASASFNDIQFTLDVTPPSDDDPSATTAPATAIKLDLEVDSNNDGTIDPATDGPIKDNPNLPGKVIAVDDISPDSSGIPGYADGYSLPALGGAGKTATGLTFAPMLVTVSGISSASGLSNFDLKFAYSESDPTQVKINPFSPAPGMLRIWSQDGNVARNDASLANNGNLIPSGGLLPLKDFTWNASANDSMTATLYVEAVHPSTKEGDIIVDVSLLQINTLHSAGSDEVRFTALRTKQSWTNQALSDAGITQAQWASQATPNNNGFTAAQQQVVQKVYAFYQALYNQKPTQFLWAGLAKIAGGAVWNGLNLAQSQFVAPVLTAEARLFPPATEGQVDAYLIANTEIPVFLQMQQDIFNDLAWQFEAYRYVGLFAIKLLPLVDQNTGLDQNTQSAWVNIDSGNATQIVVGNNALLLREQNTVLQRDYNQFQWPVGNILGEFTQALFPQSQTFTQVEGNLANIANFQTRWDWISRSILPTWNNASQAQRTAWVNAPLGSLAHN